MMMMMDEDDRDQMMMLMERCDVTPPAYTAQSFSYRSSLVRVLITTNHQCQQCVVLLQVEWMM